MIIEMPFVEDEIYPLTIVSDRYNGTYSGGAYLAFNLDADEVPDAIFSDDVRCHRFWTRTEIMCGKGRTVSEALADLYLKVKGADNEQAD